MSKEGQDEWVFDSLVGLLRGPVWNVPILTFIEHKSLSEWTSAKLYQLDGFATTKISQKMAYFQIILYIGTSFNRADVSRG